MILTDTWWSSDQFLPDRTLLQTGGDLDGFKKIRKFEPSEPGGNCDWVELKDVELANGRWYATKQILPDGTIVIVGGRGTNTAEYYPPRMNKNGAVELKFLADVEDNQMYNLYPYVHLLPTATFSSSPTTKQSLMLALEGDFSTTVVVVCGGAQYGAFIERSTDTPAHGSCGRIVATDPKPGWEMEDMPYGRIMGDTLMLPTGDTLIINGAQAGTQGFEMASNPMYHSTANLLPDGRVLVAGSNPHYFYKFAAEFPTELRLEAFSPEYLSPDRANIRPVIEEIPETVRFGEAFAVLVSVPLSIVGIIEVWERTIFDTFIFTGSNISETCRYAVSPRRWSIPD
ncbi:dynein light chain LC6, flagellar outer arm-like [Hibiscus syriacus]|uniref:Dynein light chain LC6, flagellar outer arm-like n=1 Tax=Hibiscus syriacus TaxID=106335 RepID=A0A6A2Y2N5_HIBSY|nr:dynein light chain LC6, flagellar outer arm-like [Hibiscus syriacus]